MAKQTVARMLDKVSRLYEQNVAASRIGTYVQLWACWMRVGLGVGGIAVERESPFGMLRQP